MKVANRMDHDRIDWNSFRFMVFDIPTSKGNYKERYRQLRMNTFPSFLKPFFSSEWFIQLQTDDTLNEKNHRFIRVAPYSVCEGTDHLEKIFQDIMDQGGEGIILRDPSAPFTAGRSRGFLKHKVFVYY